MMIDGNDSESVENVRVLSLWPKRPRGLLAAPSARFGGPPSPSKGKIGHLPVLMALLRCRAPVERRRTMSSIARRSTAVGKLSNAFAWQVASAKKRARSERLETKGARIILILRVASAGSSIIVTCFRTVCVVVTNRSSMHMDFRKWDF